MSRERERERSCFGFVCVRGGVSVCTYMSRERSCVLSVCVRERERSDVTLEPLFHVYMDFCREKEREDLSVLVCVRKRGCVCVKLLFTNEL